MTQYEEMARHAAEKEAIRQRAANMSLRQYYAGQSLIGYLAMYSGDGIQAPAPEDAAKRCVAYADALIAALEKPHA